MWMWRRTVSYTHLVVADLIQVNKDYEIAIETALGGSIQNIVTDNEQTAKTMIEFLKKNRYGRATFLPMSSISPRGEFTPKEALKEPGVVGIASELVSVASQYQQITKFLLGRVLVVDNIDHALSLIHILSARVLVRRRSWMILIILCCAISVLGLLVLMGAESQHSSRLLMG